MHIAMSLLALLLLLPTSALAAPWDGARVIQDGADLDGPGWTLQAAEGLFSVTWAPGVEDSGPASAPDGPATIRAGLHTLRLERRLASPRYHTDLYRLEGEADPRDVARALLARPDVAVAGPLLQTGPGAWRAITDQILLQTHDVDVARDLAERLGLQWVGRSGLAPGQHLLRVPPGADVDPVEAAMALREPSAVRWAQVDWIQPRVERFVPDDPRFPDQWHLDNTEDNAGLPDNDVDAPAVWDITLGAEEAIVAILDSGVDLYHEDLEEDLLPGWDFVDGVEGGATTGSNHGTRVTGVAAAPANGIGGVGVCPGCPILPGRVIGASDAAESAAQDWAVEQGAWVINNSWGPTDGTGQTTPIAPVMAAALESVTTLGRGGLGALVFWAAGNGHPQDTCTMDGLVAHPLTIGVGSSTNEGVRSSYSEMCPELDLSSPSNGGTAGINTTQISGYTTNFGGTSAAAPGGTGSAALLLSVVPDLRWDDARELLRLTATKIDPEYAGYDEDGHSLGLGYGRVNPWSALQGGLLLEHAGDMVGCSADLDATVVLPLAPGQGTVVVTATAPGEAEFFSLVEGASGIYVGSIRLTDGPVVADDGLLSVQTGDEVTIESADADHSQSLFVDCDVPILLDPIVEVLSPWAARVTWQTFDDATGLATWGDAPTEQGETALSTTHRVWALDLEPCTEYSADLEARDVFGNVASWPDAVSWTSPGDRGVLPDLAPPSADPCDPETWADDDDDATAPPDDDDSSDDDRETPPPYTVGPRCGCDGPVGAFFLPLLFLRRRR